MGILSDWSASVHESDARAKEARGEAAPYERFMAGQMRKLGEYDNTSGSSGSAAGTIAVILIILGFAGFIYYELHQSTVKREAALVAEQIKPTKYDAKGRMIWMGSLHIWANEKDLCRENGGQILYQSGRGYHCTVERTVDQWNAKRGVTPEMIARVKARSTGYFDGMSIWLDGIQKWLVEYVWFGLGAVVLIALLFFVGNRFPPASSSRGEKLDKPITEPTEQKGFTHFSKGIDGDQQSRKVHTDRNPRGMVWKLAKYLIVMPVACIAAVLLLVAVVS